MRVMGFAIIVLGLVMLYVGMTGSQHNIMSIIKNGPTQPSGQQINPVGQGNGNQGNGNQGNTGGGTKPEPVQIA